MTEPKTPQSVTAAALKPDLVDRFRELVESIDQTPLPEDLAHLFAEAQRRIGEPVAAWATLSATLREAHESPAIRACPEVRLFVTLLYLLVTDPEVHERGGPLRELESIMAKRRVSVRHENRRTAREWVRKLWQSEGGAFESKSEFARLMSRRLMNESGLKVTDRTIREDWLRGLDYPDTVPR